MTDPVRTDPSRGEADPSVEDPGARGASSEPGSPKPEVQDGPDLAQTLRRVAVGCGHALAVAARGTWRVLVVLGRALRQAGRTLLRWRSPLILLPLLVGLAYTALIGGRMLWEEIPEVPPPPPTVTCWDGKPAPKPDCTLPSGAEGLHWVFPSFRPRTGRCDLTVFPGDEATRPLQYDCPRRVLGEPVVISYSQRSTLKRGQSYFAKRYPGITPRKQAGGERFLYRDAAPRDDGTFEVTVAYAETPFAVTVTGDSLRVVDAAFEKLVTYRQERYIRFRPGGPVD